MFPWSVHADDLNAYKIVPSSTSVDQGLQAIDRLLAELHNWGDANQVSFDASKESKHILSRTDPHGSDFKLLGVSFDCRLLLDVAVGTLVGKMRWKTTMLHRSRHSFCKAYLIIHYNHQVLSSIDYRTSAIYHATTHLLRRLDKVQECFLRQLKVDWVSCAPGVQPSTFVDASRHRHVRYHSSNCSWRRSDAVFGSTFTAMLVAYYVGMTCLRCRRVTSHAQVHRGPVRVYNTLGGTLHCSTERLPAALVGSSQGCCVQAAAPRRLVQPVFAAIMSGTAQRPPMWRPIESMAGAAFDWAARGGSDPASLDAIGWAQHVPGLGGERIWCISSDIKKC